MTPIAYWLSVWTTTAGALGGSHSTAFKMAVSSATLFVAVPRYSNPSCILPFGEISTTPEPAGPGLPEHAPSVYAIHRPPPGAWAGAAPPPRFSAPPFAPARARGCRGCTRRDGRRKSRRPAAPRRDDLEVSRRRPVRSAVLRVVANFDPSALGGQRSVFLGPGRQHALSPQGRFDPRHRGPIPITDAGRPCGCPAAPVSDAMVAPNDGATETSGPHRARRLRRTARRAPTTPFGSRARPRSPRSSKKVPARRSSARAASTSGCRPVRWATARSAI